MHRFTSRKFILALIGQIVGILVLFFPEHTDQITQAASNVGALLLMALSSMGFISAEGKADAAAAQGKAQSEAIKLQLDYNTQRDGSQQRKANSSGIGAASANLLWLALALPLLFVGGCNAMTPTAQWYHEQQLLNAVESNLALNHKLNNIEDADLLAAYKIVQVSRTYIDEAKTYLPDGGSAFDHLMALTHAALDVYWREFGETPPPDSPSPEAPENPTHDTSSDYRGPLGPGNAGPTDQLGHRDGERRRRCDPRTGGGVGSEDRFHSRAA